MKIYVLHGYTDGLTDPIVSTDYEKVYAAMKRPMKALWMEWSKKIPTGNTAFLKVGLLPLLYMETGWNGRLRNWSYKFQTDNLLLLLEISVRSDRKALQHF